MTGTLNALLSLGYEIVTFRFGSKYYIREYSNLQLLFQLSTKQQTPISTKQQTTPPLSTNKQTMSVSAKLLKEESEQNRMERKEIRWEMFVLRSRLDKFMDTVFRNRHRILTLEARQRVLWRTIYALSLINLIFSILFVYLFVIKIPNIYPEFHLHLVTGFPDKLITGWAPM